MPLVVTHTKTLASPDSGVADKVYGSDYVSASSHALAGEASIAQGGTGLATIANAAILVSNAADSLTALVAGASQSVRRNAGNTAWESFQAQPIDAELTAIAGLTSAADKLPYFTGSGTAALTDLTAAGRAVLDDASAAAQRTTLGLAIGTDVQAFDAELAAIAGLTSAADRVPYFTGSGAAALATFTAAGRALIDDATAADQRTTLGLGTAAVKNTGTSGDAVPVLNVAGNTFASALKVSSPSPAQFSIVSSTTGPIGTEIGEILFNGLLDNSGTANYARLKAYVSEDDVGFESGIFRIYTIQNATEALKVSVGAGLFTPGATGGDKGVDSINAKAVYDDNVLLTGYVIEAEQSGLVSLDRWDAATPNLEIPEVKEVYEDRPVTKKTLKRRQIRINDTVTEVDVEEDEIVYEDVPVVDAEGRPFLEDGKPKMASVPKMQRVLVQAAQPAVIEERTHGPARRFAPRAAALLDPKQYSDMWKATGDLPTMPSEAEWEAANKKMPVGSIIQKLWETVECQAIHIDKLLKRIEALERP